MTVIETIKLTKKFGNNLALNGIDLVTREGEVHGFLGPNGAGKTTTIRLLLGLIRPTSGSAKVFGLDAWRNRVEIHNKIAYVPGEVNLWDNLTGGEVIDLFLSMRGISPEKKTREKYVELFELDPSKKCRTYSKGNRQKVALAAAFASDSELYILDEPTSGLDPLMEKTFQKCVLEMKKQGKSIFLSSHILSEVEKLADSISIIREGKIVVSDSLQSLMEETNDATLEDLFLSEYKSA